MAIMKVYFYILMDDTALSQSVHKRFVEELRCGRREHQIHFEDNICYLSTPEDICALANRLIGADILRLDRDGLVIISERSRKMCVWGVCDMAAIQPYSTYERVNILNLSFVEG